MTSRLSTLALPAAIGGLLLAHPALADPAPTADHTKFEALDGPFQSGPEVTKACLSCHTEAAKQVMKTSHWTWMYPQDGSGLEARRDQAIGKAQNVLNNFCISLPGNEPRCTSCHAGYGWKDDSFDFSVEHNVDCLVCHADPKTYRKFPTAAGHPAYEDKEWPKGSGKVWKATDLVRSAKSVGKPQRDNCGSCHFFGGGGEGVKHGDLDATLGHPGRSLDVHMSPEGGNLTCQDCHTTEAHDIAGRHFTVPAYDVRERVMHGEKGKNRLACESCHDEDPHEDPKIDDHADKVSCQACHVPTFARERPTKVWWDWSKAGKKTPEGKPIVDKADLKGKKVATYHTKKGEFRWAMDEPPEYRWYNGQADQLLVGEKIDDSQVVAINPLHGGYDDPKSRIWPVKVHRGKQPYDKKNKVLITPKLFPSGEDKAEAYWKSFDWERAARAGMASTGQDYSGELGFVQTEMNWPLAHMVAPKEDALTCEACHHPDGRLADLPGFYLPGRDRFAALDGLGLALVVLSLLGALGHALVRMVMKGRRA